MNQQYLSNTPIEQALATYLAAFSQVASQPEIIPTRSALGRISAEALYARANVPHYLACAMDGIALNARLTFAATDQEPVRLQPGQWIAVDTGDPLPAGTDAVIMIEDVTTSGKSMEETVPKVKGAANVEIVGLMVSLNRMEIGKGGEKCALDEVKELYGFDTAAIVDMEEVVECLYNKECNGKVVIDDTLKAAIDAYYEQYGAKH